LWIGLISYGYIKTKFTSSDSKEKFDKDDPNFDPSEWNTASGEFLRNLIRSIFR